MKQNRRLELRVNEAQYDWVAALAERQNCCISEVVRQALYAYRQQLEGLSPLELRKLQRDEYVMLAVDHLVTQQFPEAREHLIKEADTQVCALRAHA